MSATANCRIFARCNEDDWRVEQILHLGSMLGNIAMPKSLEQAIQGWQLSEVAPALALPDGAGNWDAEDIVAWLRENQKFGFLVQVGVPVKKFSDVTSFSSSWSHYHIAWIYADDFNRVIMAATQWVKDAEAADRQAAFHRDHSEDPAPPALGATNTRTTRAAGGDHVALPR
jgi:hypothetical protein